MWTLDINVPPLNCDLDRVRSSFSPMRTSKGDNLVRPQAQFDTNVKLINCICLPSHICWLDLKWFLAFPILVFNFITYKVPFSVWYEAAYVPTFLLFYPKIHLKTKKWATFFVGVISPFSWQGCARYRCGSDLNCSLFDQIWYFVRGGAGRPI